MKQGDIQNELGRSTTAVPSFIPFIRMAVLPAGMAVAVRVIVLRLFLF